MLPAQTSITDSDEYSRCNDQTTIADPVQKTDAALKEHIFHALRKDELIRALEYDEIDVHVKNGVIFLYGHIVGTASQSRIISAIRAIPGILRIENHLVIDDELTLAVAASLGQLEHTHDCKFFTGTSHGVVSINGIVSAEHVKLLAEERAAGIPNVRGVINNVQVSGIDSVLPERRFFLPVIGQTIYFLDGVSSAVKQVIIDPTNRLVTQLILQGKFSKQKPNSRAGTNNQTDIVEKTVAIPVNLIRYLTKSSGFLTIKSTETTQYQDFNPLYFTSPQLDWTLPYPYCPGEVLFNIESGEAENQKMVDPDIVQINISAQPTSAKAPEMPVDIIATWEDDGGQIIEPVEAETVMEVPEINAAGVYSSHVNDSPGG